MTEPFGKNAACWPKSALFKWRFGEALLKAIYTSINGLLWNQKLLIPLSLLVTSCKPQFWIFTGLRCLEKCRSAACVCKESKGTSAVASLTSHSFSVIKTPRNGLVKMQCKASLSSCVQSVFLISYSEEWSKFTSISVVTQKKIADFAQKDNSFLPLCFICYHSLQLYDNGNIQFFSL